MSRHSSLPSLPARHYLPLPYVPSMRGDDPRQLLGLLRRPAAPAATSAQLEQLELARARRPAASGRRSAWPAWPARPAASIRRSLARRGEHLGVVGDVGRLHPVARCGLDRRASGAARPRRPRTPSPRRRWAAPSRPGPAPPPSRQERPASTAAATSASSVHRVLLDGCVLTISADGRSSRADPRPLVAGVAGRRPRLPRSFAGRQNRFASTPCCACTSRSSGRAARTASSWVPRSTMRPSSTTRIWSARRMVESRCAITNVVRPRIRCAQALLDERLGLGVEAGGGLVQDQDARVGQDRARDGHALPLPARQLHAALPHDRVVALREALRELVHARDPAGRQHLLLRRVRAARRRRSRGWCRRTGTSPAARRRAACGRSRGGRSRGRRRPRAPGPSVGVWNAATRPMIVDLPAPEGPTSAVTVPGGRVEARRRAAPGLPGSYAKRHVLERHVAVACGRSVTRAARVGVLGRLAQHLARALQAGQRLRELRADRHHLEHRAPPGTRAAACR